MDLDLDWVVIALLLVNAAAQGWASAAAEWRYRERMRLFAEMQTAIFDVQDAVALGLTDGTCSRLWADRDRATAAYYAAWRE